MHVGLNSPFSPWWVDYGIRQKDADNFQLIRLFTVVQYVERIRLIQSDSTESEHPCQGSKRACHRLRQIDPPGKLEILDR